MLWIILASQGFVNGFFKIFRRDFLPFAAPRAHGFFALYFTYYTLFMQKRPNIDKQFIFQKIRFSLLTAVFSYAKICVMSKGVHSEDFMSF